ncbi:hypothetical protein Clacol_008319 [Clathrus columnatus]|uniref:Peptidase S33 tripeptidyl aminopeptidase-like C-terminal domain-containing protein n=1 Tax=Clathrus columnatus TaxID=1419009 RepID=A0AAV5AJX8_9AGAM|nr:hypothetical protein Clacol_008319 [Clathrus columnatus]
MDFSPKLAGTSKRRSRPAFHYLFAIAAAVATWILYINVIDSLLQIRQDLSALNRELQENWASLPVGTIKWWPCRNTSPGLERMECGFVIVPLDYFNSSAGVAKVALSRLQATKSPKKGSVLFNPGGPGGSGVRFVAGYGPSLQFMTGEDYDAIGFDPRGIGNTLPSVKCFADNDYDLFKVNTILDRGFDIGPNLSDPRTRDHLLLQQREAETLYQLQYEMCGRTMGDNLRYMGTSTVARDIDFITRILEGEEAPITIFGTVIIMGLVMEQFLARILFPERLGRVVIDGVVDAVAWAGYTEATYDLFLSECSKVGPSICSLAEFKDEEPAAINERIENFFKKLYFEPLSVPDATHPGILTQGRAKSPFFIWLQTPQAWGEAAESLSSAMKGNGSTLLSQTQSLRLRMDLARAAVSCNDNVPRKPAPTPEEIVDESLYTLKHVSRFSLSVVTTEPDAGCQYWPVTPPERFNGPWNHTLSYPILVHSNLLDPVTPLSSGEAVKALLGDSARLVLREGPGHCSLSLPSLCIAKVNQQYFGNGTLPKDNYLCDVNMPLFPDPDSKDLSGLSAEDRVLMEHLYTLSDYFNFPDKRTQNNHVF